MRKFEIIMAALALIIFYNTYDFVPFVPKEKTIGYILGAATSSALFAAFDALIVAFLSKKLFIFLAEEDKAQLIKDHFKLKKICIPATAFVFLGDLFIREYMPVSYGIVPYIIASTLLYIREIIATKGN